MQQLADEPVLHRDALGRFAAMPALSDEKRYANRLLVAYVESLVALSGRGALSDEENALVTGSPASLAEAVGVVLAREPINSPAAVVDEALSSRGAAHWLLWAAGIAAMLLSLPVPAH